MTPSILGDDDLDLLRRMALGDEDAFTELYRRRQGAVYRFALQMSGSPTVAEDVTQEVFIALIKQPGSYTQEKGSLASYLYGIARNHCLRRLDRERHVVPFEFIEDELTPPDSRLVADDDPLRILTRIETVENVRNAVLALPQHYREVLVLCDLHEMSYSETANVLNVAVGTVRSRLHRGRSILLEKLRATENPDAAPSASSATRCFA
jgi:RNA polymerase sigma-70 factor (ECF subfamily)